MNVKKTVKKLVALGTGATMVGATIMGAMADLSTYPAPFVMDGVVDTMIVVGATAKTMDTLGAIDIAASLQATAVTPAGTGSSGGTVTLTGDNVAISRSSDMLEMNESLGDVRKTLGANDLKALSGGTITAGGRTTKFNQYIRFNFTDPAGVGQNSGAVVYEENSDTNDIGDWLKFEGGIYMWEYQLEFTEGLQSDIDTAGTGLEDIEDETISIFGTDYTIVDTTITTGNYYLLRLMGGEVTDTLGEGETKTYTINGVDYEVTAVFISDSGTGSVKFAVNGELTKELTEGDTELLSSDMEMGVRAILTNQREGIAEFYLGANKIELEDSDASDDTYVQGVDIGGEDIDDARVKIKASNLSATKRSIASIYYTLRADRAGGGTDIYIAPGTGLREYLDEPEGMLNPTWDIKYEGLAETDMYDLVFDGRGDDKYELNFVNTEGIEYSIPVGEAKGGTFYFGTDTELFWYTEFNNTNYSQFVIAEDDYFVVSDRNDEAGVTRILQFDSVDESNKQILVSDASGEGTYKVTYTGGPYGAHLYCGNASGPLLVGGNTYTVHLCGNGTTANPFKINVDLDGDTTFSHNLNGNTVNITTMGGAMVEFKQFQRNTSTSFDTGIINYSVDVRILQKLFDENGPNDASVDETHNINVSATTIATKVDLAYSSSYATLVSDPDNDEFEYAVSLYGIDVKYHNPDTSSEANEVTLSIPRVQRGPQVFVTAGAVQRSGTGAISGDVVIVNNAAVGIGVLDRDVRLGQGNLIVVGGPCVNTIAMELMGNPDVCAEGFEAGKAVIKLYEDQNALLVAGYGWEDTLGAAYVLADYEDYELSGMEMEVVVAGLDSISVNRVE